MGMAPILLAIIHSVNNRKWIGCHTPVGSNYSSASKWLLTHEWHIALGRYRTWPFNETYLLISSVIALVDDRLLQLHVDLSLALWHFCEIQSYSPGNENINTVWERGCVTGVCKSDTLTYIHVHAHVHTVTQSFTYSDSHKGLEISSSIVADAILRTYKQHT